MGEFQVLDRFSDLNTRSTSSDILQASEHLRVEGRVLLVLDSMPDMIAILNDHNHLVWANRSLREVFAQEGPDSLLGLRPGELFGCDNAAAAESGCGTAPGCRFCGAFAAILAAQQGQTLQKDCHILSSDTRTAYDLRVSASPFDCDGEGFVLVNIRDIAAEKKRDILERTFFHDILNTAGNIHGISELVTDCTSCEDASELNSLILQVSDQLLDEIRSHRDLILAESGRLGFQREWIGVQGFLQEVEQACRTLECAHGRILEWVCEGEDHAIHTGPVLLKRVLINLVKNALEASGSGDRITLRCRHEAPLTVFSVTNPGVMDEETRHKIFRRSFSTKGPGRGLGTYSVKLLGEQLLGGQVSFRSATGVGTVFTLTLPDELPD